MSYNKALAEKKWHAWKEAEEKKLREPGIDEDTIQRLHTYDWEEFKQERRYREWVDKEIPSMEPLVSITDVEIPTKNAESLLENIDSPELFSILKDVDKQTLEILLMKIEGFSSHKIAAVIGMDEYAVNMRIYRLRKKLEKIF